MKRKAIAVADAVALIPDGARLMIGGFMGCRFPTSPDRRTGATRPARPDLDRPATMSPGGHQGTIEWRWRGSANRPIPVTHRAESIGSPRPFAVHRQSNKRSFICSVNCLLGMLHPWTPKAAAAHESPPG